MEAWGEGVGRQMHPRCCRSLPPAPPFQEEEGGGGDGGQDHLAPLPGEGDGRCVMKGCNSASSPPPPPPRWLWRLRLESPRGFLPSFPKVATDSVRTPVPCVWIRVAGTQRQVLKAHPRSCSVRSSTLASLYPPIRTRARAGASTRSSSPAATALNAVRPRMDKVQ